MSSETTEEQCTATCRGFTFDWMGVVRPCGSCQRFTTDAEAATAARAFMALFPGESPSHGAHECGPNCRGWDVFNRSGGIEVGDAIENCMGCAVFANCDDALEAAVAWFVEHLALPLLAAAPSATEPAC